MGDLLSIVLPTLYHIYIYHPRLSTVNTRLIPQDPRQVRASRGQRGGVT